MPVSLSQEKKNQIAQDFIDIFQARYGEEWRSKLSDRLQPSPVYQIAEQRGVSVSAVRKIRSQLIVVGYMVTLHETITAPINYTEDLLL
jgi:hypothetical protein